MMTHVFYYDGMTPEEARRAGYEAACDEDLARDDPETYLDENARRVLIKKGLELWQKYGHDWRIKRHEFTYYEDVKTRLRIGKTLPPHATIKNWHTSLLLESTCEGDVVNLLSTMPTYELKSEVGFVENWLRYDYAYTSLCSWCYDLRQILKIGGIDEHYEGDILEHPEEWHKPSEAARNHRPPKTASLGWAKYYNGNEYSAAAAIY